jgi:hypothetical protein
MRKLLGWVTLAITIAACGGGSGSGAGGGGGGGGTGGGAASCADAPTQCPAGQTCWFAASGDFECEPSGAGKEGDACAPTKGQPTCTDGLICLKEPGKDGVCAKLCDASSGANPCGNLFCTPIQAPSGAQTHVCH